ncbi:aspartate/glutamate racemase family protein [Ancylobacter amanitiformis]|uniref:Aspartate/glutamate racemase n=1 Tax=Ancylobacter amanitiformis TaxID=217069 RepID=A0ABU0LTW9_9HYPH|nr:aspartate/glutamate racemase family protein [Ancylobacter amanitiformis]MDQ0512151.1 aspartate/glutamate racemase [Ancylobacter amanitiformis]
MPRLALIHTVPALVQRFRPLVEAALPGWERVHRVDESLLADTIREGRLTEATEARLAAHVRDAAGAADAVLVTCSTLGEAVDRLRPHLPVPLFRIDRGMAEAAVRQGSRIGVLATLPTTLGPTLRLIFETALAQGREITLLERLCEGAFAELAQGRRDAHDAMIRAAFDEVAPQVDVVVLAQASMASALDAATDGPVRVLTSPELGIAAIAVALGARDEA